MELQRPRVTPFLPQWDLGIVLEALSKSPYDPYERLRSSNLKGLVLLYILAPNSCSRTRNRAKSKIPGIFQRPLLAIKSEFGAPNCPVRALRYYHRYLTEHPELRKDRRCVFVPIIDNNAGKELSAATISRWICTTIVNSHAAIQNSKCFPGSVKAHEVRAVATSLQLFNKVDLQAVLKAGRWSSGGTFTSFYLRDLHVCPQVDSRRTGPLVAAGNIFVISSS